MFVVEVEEWLDEGVELFGEGVEFSHEEEWVAWWGLVQIPVVLLQQRPRLAWASWHSSRSLASHAQRLRQQTFSFEIVLRTGHHCALCCKSKVLPPCVLDIVGQDSRGTNNVF